MLDDLEQNYDLINMSEEQIQILLGEYSIRCDAFMENNGMVDYYWGYFIRDDTWNGIEVFLIGFKDGVVVNYEREYLCYL